MNDFKRNDRFGSKRTSGGFGKKDSGRPSFGPKPGYHRFAASGPQGQMYPAICAVCGKSCEIPFRPDGQRPIYCRDCFGSRMSAPVQDFSRSTLRSPAPVQQMPDARIDAIQHTLIKMQLKLDQILLAIQK